MQVSIETLSGLERRLVVEIPSEEVDTQFIRKLAEVSRQVKIKGFRPGKVPDKEVKRRYGESVRHEVVVDLIEKSYWKAIMQEKLVPAGPPSIEPLQDREGEDLKFSAVFEVYPAIIIRGMNQVNLKRPVVEITREDIDKLIGRLRKQFSVASGKQAEPDGEVRVALGDLLHLNVIVAQPDGKIVFKTEKEGLLKVELVQDIFEVPGLGIQFLNVKQGDTVEHSTTLPENHMLVVNSGSQRDVLFTVVIEKIEVVTLPEMNDDFFSRFEMDVDRPKSVEEFEVRIRRQLEVERDRYVAKVVETQVADGILSFNVIDVPRALVERQVDRMIGQLLKEKPDQQLLKNENVRDLFRKSAERTVRFGLILAEIIKKHKLVADDDRVRSKVETDGIYYSDPEQYVEWVYSDEKNIESYRSIALEQQAVEYIIAQAQVVDQPMSFDELAKKQSAAEKALSFPAANVIDDDSHVHHDGCGHDHH